MSQESSADVVQEAISLGALGYVVKARVESELLAAVEAVRKADTLSVADAKPFLRRPNSPSGRVNRERPQSKQTRTFGNANTTGLAMCFIPEKWITISVGNSISFTDLHDSHGIRTPLRP